MPRWLKRLMRRRGPAPVQGLSSLEERVARLEAANAALDTRLELLSGEATTLAKALLAARNAQR